MDPILLEKPNFSDVFDWHLRNGTQPDREGIPWNNKDFARKLLIKVDDRTVRNWRSGKSIPKLSSHLEHIEDLLFGSNQNDKYNKWRQELRSAYMNSFDKKSNSGGASDKNKEPRQIVVANSILDALALLDAHEILDNPGEYDDLSINFYKDVPVARNLLTAISNPNPGLITLRGTLIAIQYTYGFAFKNEMFNLMSKFKSLTYKLFSKKWMEYDKNSKKLEQFITTCPLANELYNINLANVKYSNEDGRSHIEGMLRGFYILQSI